MSEKSARLSLGFACVGHTFSHVFAPAFYVTALTLEGELGLSHGEVVALIVAGNMLFGFGAPLAGWLGDRWSAVGMMAIYFLGMGAGMTLTGLADEPAWLAFWLAITGLFASIYHPVGIAWLVRNSVNTGTALGINGVFGGLGPALAAVTTGAIIEFWGWRYAFVVPGAVILAVGAAFLFAVFKGHIVETKEDRSPVPPPSSRRDIYRVFVVLAVTMLCTGVIYHATQPALPKAFSEIFTGSGVFGVSLWVGGVYVAGSFMQVLGGWLADRLPLKAVYLGCHIIEIPFLVMAAHMLGGYSFVALAVAMVAVNAGALPAENMLVARYAPKGYRALTYGLKFIIAFGISGLGVVLEGAIYDHTGGFYWLFVTLGAVAFLSATAVLFLPGERYREAPVAAE